MDVGEISELPVYDKVLLHRWSHNNSPAEDSTLCFTAAITLISEQVEKISYGIVAEKNTSVEMAGSLDGWVR